VHIILGCHLLSIHPSIGCHFDLSRSYLRCDKSTITLIAITISSGQSNLTKGRIAATNTFQSYSPGGANMYSRLIHACFLAPTQLHTQTASWSVRPFSQGWRSWQTDRQTDHAIYCVCNTRSHLRSTAMRPYISTAQYWRKSSNRLIVSLLCFVAARVVGDVLPVGGANYVIIPGLSSCQLWRHQCCHGNHSWNELEYSWMLCMLWMCKCCLYRVHGVDDLDLMENLDNFNGKI